MVPYLGGRRWQRVDTEDLERLELSEAFNFVSLPGQKRIFPGPARSVGKHDRLRSTFAKDTFIGQVHVVLLGDSTLDNTRYLNLDSGEPSIEQQLSRRCAQRGWLCTSLAQDGARLEDVLSKQVDQIPSGATHLVLSASGNDLLGLLNTMNSNRFSAKSVYTALSDGLRDIAVTYRQLTSKLNALNCHLALCSVYRPQFKGFFLKGLANFGLSFHNARLSAISEELDCSIIDLASILEGEDFVNALELSPKGGEKVVENVTHFVTDHPVSKARKYQQLCLLEGPHAEDDPVIHSPLFSPFDVKCCTTRARLRRVYNDVAEAPGETNKIENRPPGSRPGPPLYFSQEQQCWREA